MLTPAQLKSRAHRAESVYRRQMHALEALRLGAFAGGRWRPYNDARDALSAAKAALDQVWSEYDDAVNLEN